MKRLSLYLVILTGLLISACTGDVAVRNELTRANAELRELKKERDLYQQSVDTMWDRLEQERQQWIEKTGALQQRIQKLEERSHQCRMVESRLSGCQGQLQQVEAWAGALVQGYGPGIWAGADYLRPLYVGRPGQATVEGVIDELNARHRKHNNPLLVLKQVEGGTVIIGVTDERKLTTQMGSSGAMEYVQSAAYSLTSLNDVDCVKFEFEEGDHAAPGRFCQR